MARQKLSDHFYMDEFLVSDTARKHGLSNEPEEEHRNNILNHLVPGLEAARAILGNRAIVITSAYRNPQVNKLVGGTSTSAHPQGLAADFRASGLEPIAVAHTLAASSLKFDQLILESSRDIVHLSFDPRSRRQVMTQAYGPGTLIVNGLPDVAPVAPVAPPAPGGSRIDRPYFRDNFPTSKLFGMSLGDGARRSGFEAIFDVWDVDPTFDSPEWLAYALATAWHETGARMTPVREGFAKSDAEAVAAVTAYCKKKGKANYAARHENGNSYYGRGYVQLTHASNYKKAGEKLGLGDLLYHEPDKVLDPQMGAKILLQGMMEGWFRPAAGTLLTYFNGQETRWAEARELINGDRKAKPAWANGKTIGTLVGDYGKAFLGALRFA